MTLDESFSSSLTDLTELLWIHKGRGKYHVSHFKLLGIRLGCNCNNSNNLQTGKHASLVSKMKVCFNMSFVENHVSQRVGCDIHGGHEWVSRGVVSCVLLSQIFLPVLLEMSE